MVYLSIMNFLKHFFGMSLKKRKGNLIYISTGEDHRSIHRCSSQMAAGHAVSVADAYKS